MVTDLNRERMKPIINRNIEGREWENGSGKRGVNKREWENGSGKTGVESGKKRVEKE